MTRHETLRALHETLEQMDTESLSALLTLLGRQGEREQLTAAGVPYTGDPETDAVLNDHPDILERIDRLERGEVKTVPWSEVKARQRAKRGL